MQKKKSIFVVRVIAIVTAATAFYYLSPIQIRGLWWTFTSLLRGHTWPGFSWWTLFWFISVELLLVLKIVSAYGLFRIRSWARNFSIIVLLADFLTRLYGIINFWSYYFQHPEPHPIPQEGEGVGVIIEYISMWPTYIIAFISLILVIILWQKPIRKIFKKAPTVKFE